MNCLALCVAATARSPETRVQVETSSPGSKGSLYRAHWLVSTCKTASFRHLQLVPEV